MKEAREIADRVLRGPFNGDVRVNDADIPPVGSVDSDRLRSGTAPLDLGPAEPDARAIAEAALDPYNPKHMHVIVNDEGGEGWPVRR